MQPCIVLYLIPKSHCSFLSDCIFSPFDYSLMLACCGGHMKIAVQLVEQGASLDTKDNGGSGCLHWAVDGNKPDCIQWLLDNGIQVEEKRILCLKVVVL